LQTNKSWIEQRALKGKSLFYPGIDGKKNP
jgi:hypothetical protein